MAVPCMGQGPVQVRGNWAHLSCSAFAAGLPKGPAAPYTVMCILQWLLTKHPRDINIFYLTKQAKIQNKLQIKLSF